MTCCAPARLCALPSVCTIHLTQTARYLQAKTAALRDWIARNALGKYRGVIVAVQEARRAALAEFCGGRVRTRTIFNGVPLVDRAKFQCVREVTRNALGISAADFLVLGVGRLVERKSPFIFLKAAQKLHRRLPAARFLWVGDGKLAGEWDEWIARERMESVISRAEWQTDTLPFLLAGDLRLHVAAYEGVPFAIIEAMAAGLPCVVTRDFASEVPIFDDRSVLFLDDTAELADRIRNQTKLSSIAKGGRQLVERAFSLGAMAAAYEQLYRETARK